MRENGTIRVYHDGRCPFCAWAQGLIQRRDPERRLEFRDYHLHAADTPFPLEELDRAMHVQTADGEWHIGFFGWIAILRALPRWRWLARLLSLPPLRWLGPAAYRLIAGNRYRIPAFLLRWLGAPPMCGPGCEIPQPR